MRKWYNRNKNRILAFVCALLVGVGVMSNGMTVDASETFHLNYQEPVADTRNGYVCVQVYNPTTGHRSINTYYWYAEQLDGEPVPVVINVDEESVFIEFNSGNTGDFYYTLSMYTGTGQIRTMIGGLWADWDFGTTTDYLYPSITYEYFLREGYVVEGAFAKGSVREISFSPSVYYFNTPNVYFQGEFAGQEELESMVESTEQDNATVDNFASNSDNQSNQLNDLNQTMEEEQNRTDIDGASSEVDANLDLDAVGSYGTLLSSFTNNQYVVQILLATLSVALISYVFFGKR